MSSSRARRSDRHPPFCSNPECELHVSPGDRGVHGSGNWAELADGRIYGRSIYFGLFLCDRCRQEWRAVIAVVGVDDASREWR